MPNGDTSYNLGKLEGTLTALLENQKELSEKIERLDEKLDTKMQCVNDDITKIKVTTARNSVITGGITGVIFGFIGALLKKMIGV